MFFSKNPPKGAPEYVRSVPVTYPPSARSHPPQLVIDEPAVAVWAAQMNTVVFHPPWASRANDPDNPDQLRIDLDPPQPGTDFDDASRLRWNCAPCWKKPDSRRSSKPPATGDSTCMHLSIPSMNSSTYATP